MAKTDTAKTDADKRVRNREARAPEAYAASAARGLEKAAFEVFKNGVSDPDGLRESVKQARGMLDLIESRLS